MNAATYEIAVEQYEHWQRGGLSHRQMLQALGIGYKSEPSKAYVIHRLAAEYDELQVQLRLQAPDTAA